MVKQSLRPRVRIEATKKKVYTRTNITHAPTTNSGKGDRELLDRDIVWKEQPTTTRRGPLWRRMNPARL